ncbi:MAG: HAD-IIIA family hydrolase [Cyanobacteria bacterium J06623_4]
MNSSLKPDIQQKLASIKLLVLDVDGTLTDGGLYYTDSGEELKKFNVKDGQGIKLLMRSEVAVAIITASTSKATRHRAKKLGIEHVFVGVEDKLTQLKMLCQTLNVDLGEVGYVGDDINDIPVMKAVGAPMTLANGMALNQDCAIYTTKRAGGDGAVREICDLIIDSQATLS